MAFASLRPAARRPHVAGQDRPQPPAVRTRNRMTDTPSPLRVAIYDLDRTVLRTPTFTLFLLWAAWREARWRLLLLPALAALMIGHALRLYGRERFKPAAIRLMLGASIAPARAETLAAAQIGRASCRERVGQGVYI